ncbi:SoxR reducing system RseC family protein [Deefgea rivuli]|uniref:SoxR reducing system RseC family protein n=1 Tax=Deefgea rivuli TaxID=400948 RepID=UPI0006849C38|nr:SoxR reducing system RseC family protein [Deefgea rivuli]
MIVSEAQVERCEGEFAWVSIRPHSPCGHCNPKTGCKSVAITRLFGAAQQSYQVKNTLGARPNDLVKVAVNDGVLLNTALWAYGLPLMLLIFGAVIGSALASVARAELFSLLGAALGFAVGFLILRLRNPSAQAMQPRIVEIIPANMKLTSCSSR